MSQSLVILLVVIGLLFIGVLSFLAGWYFRARRFRADQPVQADQAAPGAPPPAAGQAARTPAPARPVRPSEPPITVEAGLRAAAALALLAIIVVALCVIDDVHKNGWSAVKYVPAAGGQAVAIQGPDISWAAAFAASAPIVAMTVIVLGALWAIWHIVRQD